MTLTLFDLDGKPHRFRPDEHGRYRLPPGEWWGAAVRLEEDNGYVRVIRNDWRRRR